MPVTSSAIASHPLRQSNRPSCGALVLIAVAQSEGASVDLSSSGTFRLTLQNKFCVDIGDTVYTSNRWHHGDTVGWLPCTTSCTVSPQISVYWGGRVSFHNKLPRALTAAPRGGSRVSQTSPPTSACDSSFTVPPFSQVMGVRSKRQQHQPVRGLENKTYEERLMMREPLFCHFCMTRLELERCRRSISLVEEVSGLRAVLLWEQTCKCS